MKLFKRKPHLIEDNDFVKCIYTDTIVCPTPGMCDNCYYFPHPKVQSIEPKQLNMWEGKPWNKS